MNLIIFDLSFSYIFLESSFLKTLLKKTKFLFGGFLIFTCFYPHCFYVGALDSFAVDIESQAFIPQDMHPQNTSQNIWDNDVLNHGHDAGVPADDVIRPFSLFLPRNFYTVLRYFIAIPVVAASTTIGCGLGLIFSIPAMGYGVYESCTQQTLLGENNQPGCTQHYDGAWRRRLIHPCSFCCVTPLYGAMCGVAAGVSILNAQCMNPY